MVPSSTIAVIADGESLTCGGVSHGETVCLKNFDFIADYFSGLSLSHRRDNEGNAFMGATHSTASTPWWDMIEDSTEEFLTASSGEGSFNLPSPRRRNTIALPAPAATTPRLNHNLNITAAQQVESSSSIGLRPPSRAFGALHRIS
jgi:hypothetical protein